MLSYFLMRRQTLLYLHLSLQLRSVIVTVTGVRVITDDHYEKNSKESSNQCKQGGKYISPTGCRCICRLVLLHHSMAVANCQLTSKGGRLLMFLLRNFGPANERVLGFNGTLSDCGTKNHNCKKHREETVLAEHGDRDLSVLFL